MMLLFLLSSCCTFASAPRMARSIALGGVRSSLTDIGLQGAIWENPAALGKSSTGVLLNYNNRFGLSDYTNYNLAYTFSKGNLGLGVGYSQDGIILKEQWQGTQYSNLWGERSLSIGFGAKGEKYSIGLSLWHETHSVEIREASAPKEINSNGITLALGIIYDNPLFAWGFTFRNIKIAGSGMDELEYSLGLRAGQEQDFATAFLDLDFGKNMKGERQIDTLGGIEMKFSSELIVRVGLDKAHSVTAGLGINKGRLQLDYAYRMHPVGNSHYFTTGYFF